MTKRSRLAKEKSPVWLSNGKKQNGGQKQDGQPFETRKKVRVSNGRALPRPFCHE
jgi:hypothetical protein